MADLMQGQAIVADLEFRVRGILADPSSVSCLVRPPTGSVVTYTYPSAQVKRLDVGQYEVSVVVNAAGTWHLRGVGTGNVEAVVEVAANVAPSRVI